MITRPEVSRPAESCDEVPGDHAGIRQIHPRGLSWVREGNPRLFERQTGDCPPEDLFRGPLKEGREEDVPQRILHHQGHTNVRGGALQKGPLPLEGLLQVRIWGLRVTTLHPSQGGHRSPSAVHLIPQPAILLQLGLNESPQVAASRHYLEAIAPEEGLHPQDVLGRHNQYALGRL